MAQGIFGNVFGAVIISFLILLIPVVAVIFFVIVLVRRRNRGHSGAAFPQQSPISSMTSSAPPAPMAYPMQPAQRMQVFRGEYTQLYQRASQRQDAFVAFSPEGMDGRIDGIQAIVSQFNPLTFLVEVLSYGNGISPPQIDDWLKNQGFTFNGESYQAPWTHSIEELASFSEYIFTAVYGLPQSFGISVHRQ